jgi:DNA-binding NarL/FixJ family response regulator
LQLRDGGGLDLIRRLSELRKAPILMALASADSPLYRQKSMAARAACFFDKDMDQDALIEALRKAGETAGSRHSTS